MDDQEEKAISARDVISALAVFVFVWGSLWLGSTDISIGGGDLGKLRTTARDGLQSVMAAAGNLFTTSLEITTGTDENLGEAGNQAVDENDSAKTRQASPLPTLLPGTANASHGDKKITPSDPGVRTLKILIGGDVMLDRGIRKLGEKNGYETLFADLTPLFKEADLVVANLEGPITTSPSKTLLANGKISPELTFTFAPKTATALAKAGFTTVSLANNHTGNFYQTGLDQTRKYLRAAGLEYFGSPSNASSSSLTVNKNGISVAFVGYHAFSPGFDGILTSIERLSKEGYFVIVMPHWGEEYASTSSASMKNQARKFVAAGAKAIFGAHPHVVEDHNYIGDVPVFYSLGNLLFDQYFSSEVMRGNLVEMILEETPEGVIIRSLRIYETSTASKQGVKLVGSPVDF